MDFDRIAELLQPFLAAPTTTDSALEHDRRPRESAILSEVQLQQTSAYLDLLLHWNDRVNLTAVREPEQIVTRHFGESLFAARHLFPSIPSGQPYDRAKDGLTGPRLMDFGSGAGFPGLPIKIWATQIELTLIESNQKKATFLREAIRKLALKSAVVFSARAQGFAGQAETVTLRAVERFENSLRTAMRLVAPEGRLVLLIGESQVSQTEELVPTFSWASPIPIPLSSSRVLMIGGARPTNRNQVD